MNYTYFVEPGPTSLCGMATGADNCPFPSLTIALDTVGAEIGDAGVSGTIEMANGTYSAETTGEVFPLIIPEYLTVEGTGVTPLGVTISIDGGGSMAALPDAGLVGVGINLRGVLSEVTVADETKSAEVILINGSSAIPTLKASIVRGGRWGVVITAEIAGSSIAGNYTAEITATEIHNAARDGLVICSSPQGNHAPNVVVSTAVIHGNGGDGVLVSGTVGSRGLNDPGVILSSVGTCTSGSNPTSSAIYCNGTYGLEMLNLQEGLLGVGKTHVDASNIHWTNDPPVIALAGSYADGGPTTADINSSDHLTDTCDDQAINLCPISVGGGGGTIDGGT